MTVPANETLLQKVYVIAPRDAAPANDERTPFRFWIEDLTNGDRAHSDTIFNGRTN